MTSQELSAKNIRDLGNFAHANLATLYNLGETLRNQIMAHGGELPPEYAITMMGLAHVLRGYLGNPAGGGPTNVHIIMPPGALSITEFAELLAQLYLIIRQGAHQPSVIEQVTAPVEMADPEPAPLGSKLLSLVNQQAEMAGVIVENNQPVTNVIDLASRRHRRA